MIEYKRLNSLVLIAFCAAVPALSQSLAQAQSPAPAPAPTHTQAHTQAQTQTVRSQAPRPPYTVEFKTTHVQTLANGTVITTETKEIVARDQDGRRMNSTANPPIGSRPAVTNVHVSDPATGDDINWNSTIKVAHDVRRPVGAARQGCWASPDGRYRANYGHTNTGPGAQSQPLQPPLPPAATPPATSPVAETDSASHVLTSGRGEGTGSTGVVMASTSSGPIVTVGPKPDPANTVHEDLGADNIMGVEVRGSRATTTTPAGAMGNDQPLVRTDEYWMAPSLGMVLRSVTDDPRIGKMQREAVSVDLTNPDPALFQPPADYKIETEVMQQVACPQ